MICKVLISSLRIPEQIHTQDMYWDCECSCCLFVLVSKYLPTADNLFCSDSHPPQGWLENQNFGKYFALRLEFGIDDEKTSQANFQDH